MDVNQANCVFPRNEFYTPGRMITVVKDVIRLPCLHASYFLPISFYFFLSQYSQHFLFYQRLYTYISHYLYFVKYRPITRLFADFSSDLQCAFLPFSNFSYTQESYYILSSKISSLQFRSRILLLTLPVVTQTFPFLILNRLAFLCIISPAFLQNPHYKKRFFRVSHQLMIGQLANIIKKQSRSKEELMLQWTLQRRHLNITSITLRLFKFTASMFSEIVTSHLPFVTT